MQHLPLGLIVLSVLIVSLQSRVVRIDYQLLHKLAPNIIAWIARVLLSVIISSWLK